MWHAEGRRKAAREARSPLRRSERAAVGPSSKSLCGEQRTELSVQSAGVEKWLRASLKPKASPSSMKITPWLSSALWTAPTLRNDASGLRVSSLTSVRRLMPAVVARSSWLISSKSRAAFKSLGCIIRAHFRGGPILVKNVSFSLGDGANSPCHGAISFTPDIFSFINWGIQKDSLK